MKLYKSLAVNATVSKGDKKERNSNCCHYIVPVLSSLSLVQVSFSIQLTKFKMIGLAVFAQKSIKNDFFSFSKLQRRLMLVTYDSLNCCVPLSSEFAVFFYFSIENKFIFLDSNIH